MLIQNLPNLDVTQKCEKRKDGSLEFPFCKGLIRKIQGRGPFMETCLFLPLLQQHPKLPQTLNLRVSVPLNVPGDGNAGKTSWDGETLSIAPSHYSPLTPLKQCISCFRSKVNFSHGRKGLCSKCCTYCYWEIAKGKEGNSGSHSKVRQSE